MQQLTPVPGTFIPPQFLQQPVQQVETLPDIVAIPEVAVHRYRFEHSVHVLKHAIRRDFAELRDAVDAYVMGASFLGGDSRHIQPVMSSLGASIHRLEEFVNVPSKPATPTEHLSEGMVQKLRHYARDLSDHAESCVVALASPQLLANHPPGLRRGNEAVRKRLADYIALCGSVCQHASAVIEAGPVAPSL